MKTFAVALCAASALLLFPVTVRAQSPSAEQPKFKIEIQSAAENRPEFTLTNLTDKAVTAYVAEFSSSSQSKGNSQMIWDALLQNHPPIEPGATISSHLPHAVGAPLPDKIEVIAGVLADGETFGEPIWVKNILKNRATRASEYEHAMTLLQRGLDENWTYDQYLQAFGEQPDSIAIRTVRSTLLANQQFTKKPELLRRAMQTMLESFARKSDLILKAMPPAKTASPG